MNKITHHLVKLTHGIVVELASLNLQNRRVRDLLELDLELPLKSFTSHFAESGSCRLPHATILDILADSEELLTTSHDLDFISDAEESREKQYQIERELLVLLENKLVVERMMSEFSTLQKNLSGSKNVATFSALNGKNSVTH